MPSWPAAGLVHISLTTDGQTYSSNPESVLLAKAPKRTALSAFIQGQHSYAEPSRYVYGGDDLDGGEVKVGVDKGEGSDNADSDTDAPGAKANDIAGTTYESITLDGGQYFRFINVHEVEGVSPTLAPLNANVVLTISGRGFTDVGSLRVRFCGPSNDVIVPATLDKALGAISVQVPRLDRPGAYSVSVSLSVDDGFDQDGWTAPQESLFYSAPLSVAPVQGCVPQLVASSLIVGGKGLGVGLGGDSDDRGVWTGSSRDDGGSDDANNASTVPAHAYIRFSYKENKSSKDKVVRGICVSEPPPHDVVLMNVHSEKRFRMTEKWDSYVFCKTPKLQHPGKVEVSVSYNQVHWHKCAGHLTIYAQPLVLGACLVRRKIRTKNGYTRTAAGKRVTVSAWGLEGERGGGGEKESLSLPCR